MATAISNSINVNPAEWVFRLLFMSMLKNFKWLWILWWRYERLSKVSEWISAVRENPLVSAGSYAQIIFHTEFTNNPNHTDLLFHSGGIRFKSLNARFEGWEKLHSQKPVRYRELRLSISASIRTAISSAALPLTESCGLSTNAPSLKA